MTIFIIYIGITGPQFRFDGTKLGASLVIKIINLNENFKNSPFNYVFHFLCECDYLPNFQFTTNFITSLPKNLIF